MSRMMSFDSALCSASPDQAYSHGAFPQADGTTRFSLWAPDASRVTLDLGDGRHYEMAAQEQGWRRAVVDCAAGTAYRYTINNKLHVPDPAARSQHGDPHGWSYVVDQAFDWKVKNWQGLPWTHTVIYELHVGLMGGFNKVAQQLPELAALGITAIELMPINEFPGTRNWGYDGVLNFAPEFAYGTPDELKHLIDTAHELGLMVFLDVVYNHFGPDGNYLGAYASGFFREDVHTPWGAAIDFRRREVRDFFCENALMWINDYRFDGLRLDAVHAISEKDFLVELAQRVRTSVPAGRHVHLVLENEDNSASLLQQGFNAQWNDDGHNVLHHLLTGEEEGYYADFAKSPTPKLARCLREGFIFQGETDHNGRSRGEPSAHLPPTAFVLFLQNHDQVGNRAFGERLRQLADPDALKAATVLLLLSPMIPLLFMGEERGATSPFFYFTDHEDKLAKAVRDGRRAEFAKFSRFNDPEVREKIPDPNAIDTFRRSKLVPQPDDADQAHWLAFYRQLLSLRREHVIPHLAGARSSEVTIMAPHCVRAAWILGNGRQLSIYLNLSPLPVNLTEPWPGDGLVFNHGLSAKDLQHHELPARSAAVFVSG